MITADTICQALQCDNPSCACHKSGGLVHCPGHEDRTPSLSVSEKNGKILVKDFGGCSQDRVISALKEKGFWPSKNGDGFSSNKTRGLTSKALADAKRLPVESLKKWGVADIDYKGRPAVYIPYRDLEGKTTDRFRLNLKQEPRLIWRKGSKTLLYGLWRLPEFQQAGELFLVEGETDCWTLWEYGISALGLPGKTNWKREWATPLKGLKIYLWQEPDAPELPAKVARDFPDLLVIKAPGTFKDISEAHIAGEDVPALIDRLKSEAKRLEKAPSTVSDKGTGEEPTQQEILLTIAATAELFHTPDEECYARFPVNGHQETWAIRSKGFKRWLSHGFYKLEGKGPNAESLQAALNVLEAQAQFDGSQRLVWVRLAEQEGNIYLDLGNPAWEAVNITPQGWKVIADPPVCFRRSRSMLPLPYPERGGSINELRPFLNLASDSDFLLMVAFIIAAMRARGPYPIVVENGEQGTAKTTTARAVGSLIDPSTSPLRSAPREVRDLMIAALNSWLMGYDNLSGVPNWISDALCRLSTGGGFSTRELYTDREETIFEAMRPITLNGIDSLANRQDLADRALIFNLPQIPEDARRPEKEFWAAFEKVRPRILGALLDAVSMALRNQDHVELPNLPRMADFAIWVTAAEPALPWPPGSFMAAYTGNRQDAVELSLEADVVAVAVRAHMVDKEEWSGSPSELYEALKDHVAEDTQKSKAWPKAAHVLTSRLKRAATFLRAVGLKIDFGKSGNRKTTITRQSGKSSAQSAQSAQPRESQGISPDASKDSSVQPGASSAQKGDGDEKLGASREASGASQRAASTRDADNHASLDATDAKGASLHSLVEADILSGEELEL
jgi:hypothetical protein